MKRLLCILLCLSLTAGLSCAFAEEAEPGEGEEEVHYTQAEIDEMEAEEKEAEEDVEAVVEGEVYHEKTKEDFDLNSPALYTGVIRTDYGRVIWAEKSTDKSTKSTPAAGRKGCPAAESASTSPAISASTAGCAVCG